MNTPYLGSKISLISRAEIRYEGILYQIDQNASTVALANVKSYGTENRPTDKPVAAQDKIYQFIIFRGQDIKDLSVSSPPNLQYAVDDDPAIVQTSDNQLKNNEDHNTDEMGLHVHRPQMNRQPPGLNNSSYMSNSAPPGQQPYMMKNEESTGGYASASQITEDIYSQGQYQQRYNNYVFENENNPRKEQPFHPIGLNKDQQQFYAPFKYEGEKMNNENIYHPTQFEQVGDRKVFEGEKRINEMHNNNESESMRLRSSGGLTESSLPENRDSKFSNYSTNDTSSNDIRQSNDFKQEEEYRQREPRYDMRINEKYEERQAPTGERKLYEMQGLAATQPRIQRYPAPHRLPYQGNRMEAPKSIGSERIPPLMPDGWQYDEPRIRHSSRPRHFMPPQRYPQYHDVRGNSNWRSSENNFYRREFDFERSNAKFSKEDIENEIKQKLKLTDQTPRGNIDVESTHTDENLCEENIFYDKTKSFFDKISCNSLDKEKSGQAGWKDERRMNAETFGLPIYDRRQNRGGNSYPSPNQRGQQRMYRPQGNWSQHRLPRSVRPNDGPSGYSNEKRARPQHSNSRYES